MPSELPKRFLKYHAPRAQPDGGARGEDPKRFLRRMAALRQQQAAAAEAANQQPQAPWHPRQG